uniref:Uncharacterized protein n=1 Tax=Anguilla anguilla TaxID=7936 RepID=A0A0E9X2Z3_ANGAN
MYPFFKLLMQKLVDGLFCGLHMHLNVHLIRKCTASFYWIGSNWHYIHRCYFKCWLYHEDVIP